MSKTEVEVAVGNQGTLGTVVAVDKDILEQLGVDLRE